MVILTEFSHGSSSSSSSSIHHQNHRYDVFLSFRGADTRNTFTDHLYNALVEADITTFLDDEEIETGELLKPELETAIQSSRVSIIVLSKNYASSTWCLDELVLILEQNRKFNQIVIPIFYDVEPTDVRKQQKSFGEAMEKHKQRMEDEIDAEKRSQSAQRMELWKMALTKVAGLKGKDSKGRKETQLIEEIVTEIHQRLGVPLSNTPPLLIGMHYKIKLINAWLLDGSCHTADILTIVGMGGIGKTSLANYVFRLHSSTFHKSSFIEGISIRSNETFNGLLDLQKQLHGGIAKRTTLQVNDVAVYTSKIEMALARKKVFIVLDDIDSLDQLDALLGHKGLHPGSKIIITTKDASLTERCELFKSQAHSNHKVVLLDGLSNANSLELLCIHAFKSHGPKEGYEVVSEKLVNYCEGHPLALEVLGKSLYKRDVAYWEECIKGLMKEPHARIKKALHMSFDSLSSNDKDLFKHIACFFVGIDRDLTEIILNSCDINSKSGITHLIDKCFLRIGYDNMLMMHQLVQEIGRDLVRQESPDKPWERSRLWCHQESFKVLEQKKGTNNLIGFALDMRMLEKEKLSGSLELKTDALSKMDNLKLLQLNYVKIKGSYKNVSKELRWLCMHGFHSKSVPSELPMENLVVLDMSYSNINSFDMSNNSSQRFVSKLKGLIGGTRSKNKGLLGSLKILDLSFCEQLHSLGGFVELPALERLIVRNCISLIKVCESVEQCVELVHIDLSCCYKLKELPISIGKLKKVKTLLLDGCNSRESQINMRDMNSPDNSIESQVSSSAVLDVIPSDLKFFTFSFPSSLRVLSLANNNLSNESFPTDFSFLSLLEELCLDNNPIVSMPNCVRSLPRLKELYMANCLNMVSIEHPPRTLRELSIDIIHIDSYLLWKIKFDPEMVPLNFDTSFVGFRQSSFEIDGMVKIQSMVDVEERVLHSLGWTNLEFIKEKHLRTSDEGGRTEIYQTQMYYEFGIFSTIYEGEGMPNWIKHRNMGSSMFFTIPSSPKKLRGLNFCCTVWTDLYYYFALPMIKISNITKNLTWIYAHCIENVISSESYLCLLTHCMFGPNEMNNGDKIAIILAQKYGSDKYLKSNQNTMECGIDFVYDEDGKIDEEDGLEYYKSWNHIIGRDLCAFQVTTGEYILENCTFSRVSYDTYGRYLPFIDPGTLYKEEAVRFKAFF